jgi:3-hydroxybutyryl-CoA dehydrogenase
MKKETVGIIGAGIMGQGLAFQCAKFGHEVVLIDVSREVLQRARAGIRNTGRLDQLMQKQHRSPEGTGAEVLENISFSEDYHALAAATVVVENVPEKIGIKLAVYDVLRDIIGDQVLVGVNTSATSITRLAAHLANPSRVVGMHFSNPVHLMPTVEMVKGFYHDAAVIARADAFLASMRMKGVWVNDSPGFVTNRIMLLYINEAILCVSEGVGPAATVDEIFRECLSHHMGPLQTADLIGLDTILNSLMVLYEDFSDSKYRPAVLLRKMVDAGLLGQKSGQGFYKY